MLRLGSIRKARAYRRPLVKTALTGSDAWLATASAQSVKVGTYLVRGMDWVRASAIEFRSALSFVHAARLIRRMMAGTSTAARMAMTASTPIISISEKAR